MKKQPSAEKVAVTFEVTKRQSELLNLMLQKANLNNEELFTASMKRWVVKNADLLTDKELKSFADILPSLQPKANPKPKTTTTRTTKKKS